MEHPPTPLRQAQGYGGQVLLRRGFHLRPFDPFDTLRAGRLRASVDRSTFVETSVFVETTPDRTVDRMEDR